MQCNVTHRLHFHIYVYIQIHICLYTVGCVYLCADSLPATQYLRCYPFCFICLALLCKEGLSWDKRQTSNMRIAGSVFCVWAPLWHIIITIMIIVIHLQATQIKFCYILFFHLAHLFSLLCLLCAVVALECCVKFVCAYSNESGFFIYPSSQLRGQGVGVALANKIYWISKCWVIYCAHDALIFIYLLLISGYVV